MKTSEVLNKAADLIEERGWVGTGGRGWDADGGDPLCLEGAISAAMGPSIAAFGGFTNGPNTCPAGQAVRDYLELGAFVSVTETPCLFQWNDEMAYDAETGEFVSRRTADEVVATLRAAAVIEAAKEQESTAALTAQLADRQPSPHARLALAGMAVAQADDGEVEARVAEMTAALVGMARA